MENFSIMVEQMEIATDIVWYPSQVLMWKWQSDYSEQFLIEIFCKLSSIFYVRITVSAIKVEKALKTFPGTQEYFFFFLRLLKQTDYI